MSRIAQTPPGGGQPLAPPRYLRLHSLHGLSGYLPGMRQPVAVAQFHLLSAESAPVLQAMLQAVEAVCGEAPALEPCPEFTHWPALAYTTRATLALLRTSGWPLLSPAVVLKENSPRHGRVLVAFPSLHAGGNGVSLALQGVLGLLYAMATGAVPADNAVAAELGKCCRRIQALAPKGMNTLRFLEAAHAQGVPWKHLTDNVYQFGWGARARLLDSTFTDQTPSIAVKISRDKRAAARLLHQAGIPVPAHARARTEAEALDIAQRLGYPVVVKPADLDGGKGVSAWLETPSEVARAFAAAIALSRQVLVEKHVKGNDYRLQVFQGEVYWATQRLPAGVTGDGRQSVRALVDVANADPRRGAEGSARLKWIVMDEETDTWLARQHLSREAVPESGRFVRLRGAANVASGGTVEPVLAIAHPDNLALAARAANVLRLDLAGVDLLIEDISRSWLESGAAICEVNAQPQMSPQLPAQLLPRLVAEQGRIPVMMVLGGDPGALHLVTLFEGLAAAGAGFGLAGAFGASLAGQLVAQGPMPGLQAAECLLCDPALTHLALHLADTSLLQTGSPVDSIDHLVLAGPLQRDGQAHWPESLLLAGWLAGMSRKVWLLDAAVQWQHPQLHKYGVSAAPAKVGELLAHFTGSLVD